MRKLIILLSLFPLFCAGQFDVNNKTITVIGIAEMEIEPDLITISMTVKETENIKKASDIVTAENKLMEFLISLEIPKDNLTIDRYSAREQYTITGTTRFRQNKTYKLIIPKAALLDTIVAKCFEVGMENVFVGKIDHSQIEELRNELLTKALLSAKNKAEIIAKEMGVSLGQVTLVNESYRIIGERQDNYNNAFYALEEVVVTGYGARGISSSRTSSTINLQKLHLSKAVIVKFEIN